MTRVPLRLWGLVGVAALCGACLCQPQVTGAPCKTDDNCPLAQHCNASGHCDLGPRTDAGVRCGAGCPSGSYCAAGDFCAPLKTLGATCAGGTECGSTFCEDGVCCNSQCQGCQHCDSAPSPGTCTIAAAGDLGMNGDCQPYVCNGVDAGCPTHCASSADCDTDAGSACVNGHCTGLLGDSQPCTGDNACLHGHCVAGICCDQTCDGGCQRCDMPAGTCGLAGPGSPGSCGSFVCDGTNPACPTSCTVDTGCVPSDYCDAGACLSRHGDDFACSANDQCSSGFCANGKCCNAACGPCGDCGNGACTIDAAGFPGSPSCGLFACDGLDAGCPTTCATDLQCANTAYCDGGSCYGRQNTGTACGSNSECLSGVCAGSVCCSSACGPCGNCAGGMCGNAAAGAAGMPPCGAYLCSGMSDQCPTSCTSTTDCVPQDFCSGGLCVARTANGGACGNDSDCASGFCVLGSCCQTACGFCGACTAATSWSCLPDAVGNPGSPSCNPYLCNGASSNCPSSCDGGANQCAAPHVCNAGSCGGKPVGSGCATGAECASGFCIANQCCSTTCGAASDGCLSCASGSCSAAKFGTSRPACGLYVCDGASTACPQTCNADVDCAPGNYCSIASSQCVPKQANDRPCNAPDQCVSGICSSNNFCCSASCGQCGDCTSGTCVSNRGGVVCGPGANFVCANGNSDCPVICGNDANCAPGYYCSGSNCIPKQADGTACVASDQCANDNCFERTCCNSACGPCGDCSTGQCGALISGSTGFPSCEPYICDGTHLSCGNTCPTGDNGCASDAYCRGNVCYFKEVPGLPCNADDECISTQCDQNCCSSSCGQCGACDSMGTCNPDLKDSAGTPPCGNGAYVCDGVSIDCPTSCSPTMPSCAPNYACVGGSCVSATSGMPCITSATCGGLQCITYYRDKDLDGYGNPDSGTGFCGAQAPAGYTTDFTDCCDTDNGANPGQSGYFTGPDTCGSFDWNCDGVVEQQYPNGYQGCGWQSWCMGNGLGYPYNDAGLIAAGWGVPYPPPPDGGKSDGGFGDGGFMPPPRAFTPAPSPPPCGSSGELVTACMPTMIMPACGFVQYVGFTANNTTQGCH